MSEDKKITENEETELNEAEKLKEELEALRGAFQQKLDETIKESEEMPVIQELEYGEDLDEDDDDDEDEDDDDEDCVPEKKKKRSIGKIIAISIPCIALVMIIGLLLTYVVASITNPNFSSFISAYALATSAETYDEKMECYEKALEYCSDDESFFQQAMKRTILEEIVVAVYEEKGYASAYSYMKSNMNEEHINKPISRDFKKFVGIVEDASDMALQIFEKVFDNIGESKELPEDDVLSKGISIPSGISENVYPVLTTIASGYILNTTSEGLEDSLNATKYYASAYQSLVSLGADAQELAESIVVLLYNRGFVIEALIFNAQAVDPANTPVNSGYVAINDSFNEIASINIKILDIAEKAIADNKTEYSDILAAVKDACVVSDNNASILADIVSFAVKGFAAETEHNLTRASTIFATVASFVELLGIDDASVYLKTTKVIFDCGELTNAKTLLENYLTDEKIAGLSDEEKAIVENMKEVFAALTSANTVFSPYYSQYYNYGITVDFSAASTALNALITSESSDYLKGFVNYCLYFSAIASEDDSIDLMKYLRAMESFMPDLPFVYTAYFVDEYLIAGDYRNAEKYAQKILDINIADGYANSVIAFCERVNGDVDASAAAAVKGIELSSGDVYCSRQAVIAYMLLGDFETAFSYLVNVVNSEQPSLDAYDLVLVFNALYDGTNEEIKTELTSYVASINQMYSYYGATSYADTTAIINGTKSLEDVFMGGNYDLTDDK